MPDPAADFVERTGKLFEVGSWDDRDFSLSPEELSAAAAAFTAPVPVDLSHTPTVLDGRLGELVRVEARGGELHGTARLPRWLDGLLASGHRKVSLLWDRDSKTIRRLSLVPHPRIADAALFAAFSAAGGCLGAAEGCSCDVCSRDPARPGKGKPMSWLKKLKDALAGNPELGEDDVLDMVAEGIDSDGDGDGTGDPAPTTATPAPAPAPAFSETPEYRQMKKDLDDARRQVEAERRARVKSEAAAFAADEVRACRALPAERANLEAAFIQAADDDHAHGGEVAFSAGGTAAKGSRVAMLRALQAARSPHVLTHELVGLHDAGSPGVDTSGATVLFSGGSEETDEEIAAENDRWAASRPYLRKKGAASA
jgi:hypothetical protein